MNLLKAIITLSILISTEANAKLIKLEFSFDSGVHHKYTSDDGERTYEFKDKVGPGSVFVQFESDLNNATSSTIEAENPEGVIVKANYHGILFDETVVNSTLGLEELFRSNNPNYGGETTSKTRGQFASSFWEYPQESDTLSYGRLGIAFTEVESSYSEELVDNHFINTQGFGFHEYISFSRSSSEDGIKAYSLDSMLRELTSKDTIYDILTIDSFQQDIYENDLRTRLKYVANIEIVRTYLSLKSINGVTPEQYFAQVPEPSTLAIFSLALIGLRYCNRNNKLTT